MTPAHWSATENRVLEPWARSDGSLHGVRFRFDPTAEFLEDDVTWFDRASVPDPFVPEFLFDVDVEALSDRVDIPLGDLRAVVVVRDRALKRWEAIRSWPLAELPESYVVPVSPDRFALGRRTEFVLFVTPAVVLPEREGRAHRPDQVVASRSFAANVRKEGSRFNVATVEAEWFERNGMPKDAVWAIDWNTRDPSVEPIAALTVVVNERFADKLQGLFGAKDAGGDALAGQIAADVFVEASVVALQNAEDFDDEPSTLLGSVVAGLGIRNADDFEALKARVQDDAGRVAAPSFLRARVQSRMALGRALGKGSGGAGR